MIFPLLLATLVLVAGPALADGGQGQSQGPLMTGASSFEPARSPIPQGLDALMPRSGAYERALDAAARGENRLAAQLFGAAAAELRRSARDRPDARPSRALLRSLLRKTNLHAADAFVLAAAEPVAAREAPSLRGPEQRLREVLAAHNLYLAHRAFHGRPSPSFGARIEALYRAALASPAAPQASGVPQADPARIHFQLGLAGLLADGGDLAAAAAAFAAVPAESRTADVVDSAAHYHAASGRPDDAFDALFAARDELPDWREIASVLRISNDLDPLREDPRFARIFGPAD